MGQTPGKEPDLINEVKNGSKKALDDFYNQYSPLVFRIAMKFLKNRKDAEDLCHDVFVEIYNNPYSFNPNRGSIEAWVAVKTKSRCLDRIRQNKHILLSREEELIEKQSDLHLVEELVVKKADAEVVHNALKGLPAAQRDVIYKNYFKGYSHRELAKQLNRPLGTIKSLVRYGVRNLRKQFEKENYSSKARGEKNEM